MVPLWAPSIERKQSSLLTAFAQQEVETTPYVERFDYLALHDWSIEQREAFWSRVWEFCGVLGRKVSQFSSMAIKCRARSGSQRRH